MTPVHFSAPCDTGTPGLPQVTLTYSYDPDGNETSVSDSLGGVVSYSYDSRNELTSQTFSGTGLSPEAVAYGYDAAGRLTSLTRYSNLAETTEVAATSYTYDEANRMTGITDKNSSGTTLVSYAYTYDAANRVTQEVRVWDSGSLTDTLTYGYTNNDQLTSVTHTNSSFTNESFSYDANGNQTGTGYTTTAGNEQTASPGYTYTYDHDGNLITSTQTSTGDYWTYSYDFRDRMTGAVEKTSGGTVLAQVTFTYDALDNRIGMDENGSQTWTLYDGDTPVMDFNGSGSLTMRYLWGPAGILARQTSGGTVSWYLADQFGTVRDLINNSGAVIDHVDFSAFGTVLDESSPSSGDRFVGFAGLQRDTVTGLNLAVEREESPGTGRWDSQDPTGFSGGDANLYRYGHNAPVLLVDPTGLQSGATGDSPYGPVMVIPVWGGTYYFFPKGIYNGKPVRVYEPDKPDKYGRRYVIIEDPGVPNFKQHKVYYYLATKCWFVVGPGGVEGGPYGWPAPVPGRKPYKYPPYKGRPVQPPDTTGDPMPPGEIPDPSQPTGAGAT